MPPHPEKKWERGEFRHVAVTWDKINVRIYLDGILSSTVKIRKDAMPKSFNQLSIGPSSAKAWKNPDGDAIIAGNSLIDDFRIYDRPLPGAEIEGLFVSYGVKQVDKSKIPVKILLPKMMITPDGKALNFDFSMTRTTMKRSGFPVGMEVLKDGMSVLKTTLNSPSAEYRHVFKLSEWKEGNYEIILCPVRETAGDKIENRKFFFVIGECAPVIDHSVPAPWKPVSFRNGEFASLMSKAVLAVSCSPVSCSRRKLLFWTSPCALSATAQPSPEKRPSKLWKRIPTGRRWKVSFKEKVLT